MNCIFCGKEAKYRLSPDLDIKGIGGCEEHKTPLEIAYYMLIVGDEKEFYKIVNSYRKKFKLKKYEQTAR